MTFHFSLKSFVVPVFTIFAVALSFSSFPLKALAETYSTVYQPRTQLEFISYMQGMVDTLQAQINAKNNTSYGVSSLVDTKTAHVESEVQLNSSFDIGNHSYVYAWFEYGENNSLTKATKKTRVNDSKDKEVKHSQTITNLKNNTVYSYRAVYETSRGVKYYGQIKTFQVGIAVNHSISAPVSGTNVSTNRGSLATDATIYTESDEEIKVSWTITNSRNDQGNWIGMYKISDNNNEYQSWKYIEGTRGTTVFDLQDRGTYEFRLFFNNSYDDVVTSRRVTIR